ncbi:rpa5 (nucleomorph) [Hemiselmis andersenii]|uniref:Rpa5 n=2 Tax=Hemiselmis andersenii TaxID=464988 RepID=A9BKT2_HEMAN|nr:rpa5 [Hemiselmis andersenii]ABW98087.1 rpa5 [Hemiselmis andersenii]|mmetsp:Transcript_27322/g.66552  ORF Transcript_27322/g.66552 Transcript_27322/m.66552 type:complete len:336 (-) Transcript_27322:413-1420(-)
MKKQNKNKKKVLKHLEQIQFNKSFIGSKNFIENQNPFSISDFRYGISIKAIKKNQEELIFQIKGFDFSFSNALRRILLSEISIFGIEKVFFYDNSSILNDEIIAHRLGMIPLFVSPHFIDYSVKKKTQNFLKIILNLRANHPNNFFKNISIYSKSLKWKKYGVLKSFFKNVPVKPVFKDILIAKLNPGQKIECECESLIGIGNNHAKFSPVGSTFYKIFPKIKIISEIFGKEAVFLVQKCPMKVFDLEEFSLFSLKRLFVSSPNYCTMCKECIDFPKYVVPKIRIGRNNQKITFIIETTGIFSPEILFHRAIFLLVGKCNQSLLSLYQNFQKEEN